MSVSRFYFRTIEVDFNEGVQLDLRARLAFDLIRTYGLIAGADGGEDGANRAKMRLQTPEEVVSRCFSLAEIVIATCEQRGYLKDITLTREDLDVQDENRSNRRYQRMTEKAAALKAQAKAESLE